MEQNLKEKLKEELKQEINKDIYDDLRNVTGEIAGKVREEISYDSIKNQEKAQINEEVLTMGENNEISKELNNSVNNLIKEDRKLKKMFLFDLIGSTAMCAAAIYLLHRKRK